MAKPDPALLPLFSPGESLTIQRNVDGKNVLMYVAVEDASSIGPRGMQLKARMVTWGESSYADGRVARQLAVIERLLGHLQEHCTAQDCPHRTGASTSLAADDRANLGLATTEQLVSELDTRLRVHHPKTDTLTPWPEVADLRAQLTPEQLAYRTVDQ